jgi:hypothetical protein
LLDIYIYSYSTVLTDASGKAAARVMKILSCIVPVWSTFQFTPLLTVVTWDRLWHALLTVL